MYLLTVILFVFLREPCVLADHVVKPEETYKDTEHYNVSETYKPAGNETSGTYEHSYDDGHGHPYGDSHEYPGDDNHKYLLGDARSDKPKDYHGDTSDRVAHSDKPKDYHGDMSDGDTHPDKSKDYHGDMSDHIEIGYSEEEDVPEDTHASVPVLQGDPYCPPCLVWKTCGDPCKQECHPTTKDCTCRPGCFCPNDLKLNNDGQCVSPYLCPRKKYDTCCNGKTYTTCGNDCAQTCGSEVCALECKEGCYCMKGTKDIAGVCLPPFKCRKCINGKEYQECGSRCGDMCGCNPGFYPKVCQSGCFCPKGKRIVDGECKPEIECRTSYNFFYPYRE